ncbi:hypothetical protein SDC9_163390 [bioreactor metagenome]|uniref:Uncharacterized protein n=1 Tax=bioreactor metagenome TaxID=1076179 RepID=A0A645FR11_9ZZZZ
MRKIKTVKAYIYGKKDSLILGNLKCLNNKVKDFLVILSINLKPACISYTHRILLSAPDTLRRNHFSVNYGHNYRKS